MISFKKRYVFLSLLVTISLLAISPSTLLADAQDRAKADAVVDTAAVTLNNFISDPDMAWFRNNVKKAQGVFIVPSLLKAGFIFGGSGGTGVLMGRSEANGSWSQPAFFTMGSASFGFAAGAEKAEVILMIMTKKGMDSMLSTSFKLGGDVSVAAGPVGAGAKVQTADVLAFSRTKGIYGGISIDGSVIKTRDSLNTAYYGKDARTVDIVIRRNVVNPDSAKLIDKISKVAK